MYRKLILKTGLSPGDVCTLTAALESLHATYPEQYVTDVRTPCNELFYYNPRVCSLSDSDAELIDLHYTDLVQCSSHVPNPFLRGFCHDLGKRLGVSLELTTNRPHLYLSEQESFSHPVAEHALGEPIKYWLLCAGTKRDFTLKQWPIEYYQEVIEHFRGSIHFVQIGSDEHDHPALNGVINLVGKTSVRDLICLAYHAVGGLGPITLLQHLCAAFEKPYVALLGGREPVTWTQYPLQTTLHTLGMLECCKTRACWRSRVVSLGDGSEKDKSLCELPVREFTRPVGKCMALITPADVIRTIEGYLGDEKISRSRPIRLPNATQADVDPVETDSELLELIAHSAWGFDMKIAPATRERAWMDESKRGFAYHCLPMVIANQSGWFILSPHGAIAEWNGGSEPEDLKIEILGDAPSIQARSSAGHGILTWTIPYVFRTPPGWNLLCRGPANVVKDGIFPLEGLVETDWAVASFSMNWKFTRPCRCEFRTGEPVAMLVPQRRFDLEAFRPRFADLRENLSLANGYETWVRSRMEFWKVQAQHDHQKVSNRFQQHYFHGCANRGGSHFSDHQMQRRLSAFAEHIGQTTSAKQGKSDCPESNESKS